ncbi:hypothetical protein LXL04_004284 [Taraxacum kok-saghyz]
MPFFMWNVTNCYSNIRPASSFLEILLNVSMTPSTSSLSRFGEALVTTIVLNSLRDWVKNRDKNTRVAGAKVVDIIKDDSFWEDVESPKMGEIYEKMDNMLGEIKDIMQ